MGYTLEQTRQWGEHLGARSRFYSRWLSGNYPALAAQDLDGAPLRGLCRLCISTDGSLVKVRRQFLEEDGTPLCILWALTAEEVVEAWHGRVWFEPGEIFHHLDAGEWLHKVQVVPETPDSGERGEA